MSELYRKLRIEVTASQADIRRAYHKLALMYHPDRNLGDKLAEAEFKSIVSAFEVLGDPKQRALYDLGRIDDQGRVLPRRSCDTTRSSENDDKRTASSGDKASTQRDEAGGQEHRGDAGKSSSHDNIYFDETAKTAYMREKQYRMSIDFVEACIGTTKHVRLPNKAEFKINIPAGVKTEQRLRVKSPGVNGKPFVVKIRVEPHPLFTRQGEDIHLEVPVTPYESYFGVELDVPTIHGPSNVVIPANAKDGDEVLMKNKGLRRGFEAHGHQIVVVRVVLPNVWPESVKTAMADWRKLAPYNPRGKIMRLLAG